MTTPQSLLDLLTAYRRLQVVAVACELGVFSRLAAKPAGAADLALDLAAEAGPLAALLEVCVAIGLLRVEEGRYLNQPLAEIHLVEGRPQYLGHLIHVFATEAPQWNGLGELVKTGAAPPDAPGGEVESRRFTLAMHSLGVLGEAEALAAAVPLVGCRDLVDVGGGSGIYSIALCRRFPEIRATLLDREEVLDTTREIVAASGIGHRISLEAADIVADSYGQNRDVVLFSDVLYLGEDACLAMLRSAFRALAPGGRLVVRGYFSDPDHSHPAWGALFDLARMLWDASRTPITHICLRGWLGQVGFTDVELFPLTEHSTCALARRGA